MLWPDVAALDVAALDVAAFVHSELEAKEIRVVVGEYGEAEQHFQEGVYFPPEPWKGVNVEKLSYLVCHGQ